MDLRAKASRGWGTRKRTEDEESRHETRPSSPLGDVESDWCRRTAKGPLRGHRPSTYGAFLSMSADTGGGRPTVASRRRPRRRPPGRYPLHGTQLNQSRDFSVHRAGDRRGVVPAMRRDRGMDHIVSPRKDRRRAPLFGIEIDTVRSGGLHASRLSNNQWSEKASPFMMPPIPMAFPPTSSGIS